jgi:hypothetical protein
MKTLLAIAGVAALLWVPRANATVEVRIINIDPNGTTIDGDTGWITGTATNASFVGAVGNYDITSAVSVAHTTTNPLLDLSYGAHTLTNSNPGTIIIEAMSNGYTVNTPGFLFLDNGNSLFSTGTFTDEAFGGNNNNICPGGVNTCWSTGANAAPSGTGSNLIASGGPFTSPTTWSVNKTSSVGNTANPYSLGIVISLANPTGLSTMTGDANINFVPEPASVMLLGGVLLFVAGAVRRKVSRA